MATIALPRKIKIGGGLLDDLGELCCELGIRKALIVSDRYLEDIGVVSRAVQSLARTSIASALYAKIDCEPTVAAAELGRERYIREGCDGLVALGGGSAIDAAKAIGLLVSMGGRLVDYKAPAEVKLALPPLIAVPTTAGTGSEVTGFTVVTDEASGEKMLISGSRLVPLAAIVDYELTMTAPARLTADTGLDALTHAIEAVVSRKANAFTDSLAFAAMKTIYMQIRHVVASPDDQSARSEMMLAATQAGIAFAGSSVALVHGMSRPLGAVFHVPHGLANAMLLPAVTAFSLPAALGRYAACARQMGIACGGDDDATAANRLIAALRQLTGDLGVPSPEDYGIEAGAYLAACKSMAEQAIASGSPAHNPRIATIEEIISLYQSVFSNRAYGHEGPGPNGMS